MANRSKMKISLPGAVATIDSKQRRNILTNKLFKPISKKSQQKYKSTNQNKKILNDVFTIDDDNDDDDDNDEVEETSNNDIAFNQKRLKYKNAYDNNNDDDDNYVNNNNVYENDDDDDDDDDIVITESNDSYTKTKSVDQNENLHMDKSLMKTEKSYSRVRNGNESSNLNGLHIKKKRYSNYESFNSKNKQTTIGSRDLDDITCTQYGQLPKCFTERIRSYLDVVFSAIMIEAVSIEQSQSLYAIPGVVKAILAYNNIAFDRIQLKRTQMQLHEPIWYLINTTTNTLTLVVNEAMYDAFCLKHNNKPIIFTSGHINIDTFDPFAQPENVPSITIAMIHCVVACDHVAQHILIDILLPKSVYRINVHDQFTRCGTTLHSIFAIEQNVIVQKSRESNNFININTFSADANDFNMHYRSNNVSTLPSTVNLFRNLNSGNNNNSNNPITPNVSALSPRSNVLGQQMVLNNLLELQDINNQHNNLSN